MHKEFGRTAEEVRLRREAFEEAAQLVDRFNGSPVVIPPNGSYASVIAAAIRNLK
jgi:hypothetical protein